MPTDVDLRVREHPVSQWGPNILDMARAQRLLARLDTTDDETEVKRFPICILLSLIGCLPILCTPFSHTHCRTTHMRGRVRDECRASAGEVLRGLCGK